MIFVADFWPFLRPFERRTFTYTTEDGSMPPLKSVYVWNGALESMEMRNYDAKGVWLNTWFYRNDPEQGVLEWRDDYPQESPLASKVWGNVRKQVYSEPIKWGWEVEIGEKLENHPVTDCWRSSPPQFGTGTQSVLFEELHENLTFPNGMSYKNVLQFVYQQSWNTKTTGARYWSAEFTGPVAQQWLARDASGNLIQTARMDAVVSTEMT